MIALGIILLVGFVFVAAIVIWDYQLKQDEGTDGNWFWNSWDDEEDFG